VLGCRETARSLIALAILLPFKFIFTFLSSNFKKGMKVYFVILQYMAKLLPDFIEILASRVKSWILKAP